MKLRYALPLSLILPFTGQAQTQNALDFDGVDDQVIVSNAGSLVTGSTAYSMTLWVKPRNANPLFPDFDGFAGFRDDVGADLYITQVGPTLVEARFRNSVGDAFDISYNGVTLNTWAHLALVVDGSSMILYHNGAPVATVPASGTLSSNAGTFLIGNSFYSPITNFWLDGQVDEVSLWSTAITAQQVDCIARSGIDMASPGLQLYYRMDEGIAGGNNTSVTSLADAMGNGSSSFSGIAFTGATSNFVGGATVGTTLNEQICSGESYLFNGQSLSQAGTYTAAYSTGGTCDSLVTLVLGVTTVNTKMVQSNGNLISQAVGGQYQWLDCGNGYAEIPGATGPSYALTVAGSYAVEVTRNGCGDTSSCVSNVGVEELQALSDVWVRYDRSGDAFVIAGAPAGAFATVFDTRGREMSAAKLVRDRMELSSTGLPEGIYLVRVLVDQGSRSFRVAVTR